jgi:hypothetical protein
MIVVDALMLARAITTICLATERQDSKWIFFRQRLDQSRIFAGAWDLVITAAPVLAFMKVNSTSMSCYET